MLSSTDLLWHLELDEDDPLVGLVYDNDVPGILELLGCDVEDLLDRVLQINQDMLDQQKFTTADTLWDWFEENHDETIITHALRDALIKKGYLPTDYHNTFWDAAHYLLDYWEDYLAEMTALAHQEIKIQGLEWAGEEQGWA